MSGSLMIVNQYATTPDTGYGGRSFYMADELASTRLTYLVIGSHHHMSSNSSKQRSFIDCYKYNHINMISIRTLPYKSSSSIIRVINWFVFLFGLCMLSFRKLPKIENVVYSTPSLVPFLSMVLFKLRFKSKLILDIRDIWPLTLITVGGANRYNPLIIFMSLIERFSYSYSDHIISNVEFMNEYVNNIKEFTWIPNGINLLELSNPEPLDDPIYESIPKDKFVVGYTGALGDVNCIDVLLKSAKLCESSDVVFVIVGSHPKIDTYKDFIKENNMSNVIFFPKVSKRKVQSIMAVFDCCYIGWRNSPLYNYGVAPNKLPEYLYSKKPIVHSFSGKGDLVSKSKSGFLVPAECPKSVAEAILKLSSMPAEIRENMGSNGHDYVVKNLNYESISKKLSDFVLI